MDNDNDITPANNETRGSKLTPDGERVIPGRHGGLIRPYAPGQSGNPSGMKKGTLHFKTIMNRLLSQEMEVTINGQAFVMTRREAIMLEKIRLATNSDYDAVRLRAIMDIEDRIDGKPIGVLPAPPDNEGDGVIFYIPNQHSRKRENP